jgi:nicotinate-nucleotide pyrophosphorylase (carboxylating)
MSEIDDILIRQVELALMEDIGPGDITTLGCIPDGPAEAEITAKSEGVVAGLPLVEMVFYQLDQKMSMEFKRHDGDHFGPGDKLIFIKGNRRAIMTGERSALNFLGHLSGVATLTARFVEKIKGSKAKILDTRKTMPGMRHLEKYAVTCGGGENHRYGLYDMVLIKDNHISSCGSVKKAVEQVRGYLKSEEFKRRFVINPDDVVIEVEVESEAQLKEALACGITRLLLDNQTIAGLSHLVKTARSLNPEARLEASGNMTLDRVAAVAAAGVDYISIGALTHSAPSSDFSLRITG